RSSRDGCSFSLGVSPAKYQAPVASRGRARRPSLAAVSSPPREGRWDPRDGASASSLWRGELRDQPQGDGEPLQLVVRAQEEVGLVIARVGLVFLDGDLGSGQGLARLGGLARVGGVALDVLCEPLLQP